MQDDSGGDDDRDIRVAQQIMVSGPWCKSCRMGVPGCETGGGGGAETSY
jgi:hypothetical protein